MNKEKLMERLFDREEFEEHKPENNKDSQLDDLQAQNAIYHQYFNRLLDILEEADNHGLEINDNSLINYLKICEGGVGPTKEAAEKDMWRRQKLMSKTLKGTVVAPVKNVADYAKKGYRLQILEFIIVGVIIGILSFTLPHKWDLEALKEPIKVQIIEQTIPQSQSESITSENSAVVVPMKIL